MTKNEPKAPKPVSRSLGMYKSYNFIDKDPIIGILQAAIDARELPLVWVSEMSGVRRQTLDNWFYGRTKRPSFPAAQAVAKAIGGSLEMTFGGYVWEAPKPLLRKLRKQNEEIVQERAAKRVARKRRNKAKVEKTLVAEHTNGLKVIDGGKGN